MKTVRIGIVGMGNMGKFHADYLMNKKVARGELTAVSDATSASTVGTMIQPRLRISA